MLIAVETPVEPILGFFVSLELFVGGVEQQVRVDEDQRWSSPSARAMAASTSSIGASSGPLSKVGVLKRSRDSVPRSRSRARPSLSSRLTSSRRVRPGPRRRDSSAATSESNSIVVLIHRSIVGDVRMCGWANVRMCGWAKHPAVTHDSSDVAQANRTGARPASYNLVSALATPSNWAPLRPRAISFGLSGRDLRIASSAAR